VQADIPVPSVIHPEEKGAANADAGAGNPDISPPEFFPTGTFDDNSVTKVAVIILLPEQYPVFHHQHAGHGKINSNAGVPEGTVLVPDGYPELESLHGCYRPGCHLKRYRKRFPGRDGLHAGPGVNIAVHLFSRLIAAAGHGEQQDQDKEEAFCRAQRSIAYFSTLLR
jgi:hypothetical protein